MRLILMRHGNTFEKDETPIQVGARTDLPLTSFGKEQAKRVLEYLLEKKIVPKAIYSGNLKRQIESALIIGNHFKLTPLKIESLTEIDYGLWEGLTAEKIQTEWPKEYKEWTEEAIWPKNIFNSSYSKMKKTLDDWLRSLTDIYNEKDTVFAVTSNGLLRFFKNEKVKTGHFCELKLYPGGFEIHSWNQTSPFPSPNPFA